MKLSNSYLAGLFDGEGCIFIGVRKGKKLPNYNLICSICMTHRPMIELLAKEFTRNITVHKIDLKKPHCKRAYEVVFGGNWARDFLKQVYAYLIVKKEEARLAILFQQHMNEYRGVVPHLTGKDLDRVRNYREKLRLRLKACKQASFLGATDWNAGEFGGHPMPGHHDAEGQSRAKQGLTTPGVCNEQVPAPKGKICSVLRRNAESVAEMTTPGLMNGR